MLGPARLSASLLLLSLDLLVATSCTYFCSRSPSPFTCVCSSCRSPARRLAGSLLRPLRLLPSTLLRPFEHGNVEHARSSWNSATQARVLAVRFARDLATALSFPHLSMPTRTASSLRVAPTSEKKIRALPDEALRSEGGELGAERGRGSSGRRAETVETCQRVVIRSRLTVVLCVGARGRVGERWRWFPCEKRKDVSSLGLSKLSSCLAYLHRVA